jgi:hypothetical protein
LDGIYGIIVVVMLLQHVAHETRDDAAGLSTRVAIASLD